MEDKKSIYRPQSRYMGVHIPALTRLKCTGCEMMRVRARANQPKFYR